MSLKKLLISWFMLTFWSNSFAWGIHGVGNQSCGSYVETMKLFENKPVSRVDLANYGQYGGWVTGFLSGVNAVRDDALGSNMEWDAFKQWLINYCENNPLDRFAVAVDALAAELINRQ